MSEAFYFIASLVRVRPDFRKLGRTRGDSGGYPPLPPLLPQILGRTRLVIA